MVPRVAVWSAGRVKEDATPQRLEAKVVASNGATGLPAHSPWSLSAAKSWSGKGTVPLLPCPGAAGVSPPISVFV